MLFLYLELVLVKPTGTLSFLQKFDDVWEELKLPKYNYLHRNLRDISKEIIGEEFLHRDGRYPKRT